VSHGYGKKHHRLHRASQPGTEVRVVLHPERPAWDNSTVLSGPLEEEVRARKAAPGAEIGITGGISVVRALMRADHVDEYRLLRRRPERGAALIVPGWAPRYSDDLWA